MNTATADLRVEAFHAFVAHFTGATLTSEQRDTITRYAATPEGAGDVTVTVTSMDTLAQQQTGVNDAAAAKARQYAEGLRTVTELDGTAPPAAPPVVTVTLSGRTGRMQPFPVIAAAAQLVQMLSRPTGGAAVDVDAMRRRDVTLMEFLVNPAEGTYRRAVEAQKRLLDTAEATSDGDTRHVDALRAAYHALMDNPFAIQAR